SSCSIWIVRFIAANIWRMGILGTFRYICGATPGGSSCSTLHRFAGSLISWTRSKLWCAARNAWLTGPFAGCARAGRVDNPGMPKTIALIAHHAGSLLNFRGDWIQGLCASGARVWCLAPDYLEEDRAAVRRLGAEPVDYGLQRTGMNPVRDLCDAWALVRLLRRLRPDVTFAFSTKPVIYGSLAAWAARVPRRVAMIEGVGFVFTDGDRPLGWKRRILRRVVGGLYRLALSRAHRVIFLNPDDRREFVE